MNWIKLKATCSATVSEWLEESLLAAGASAITMEDAQDQALLEPALGTMPLWDQTIVSGLFEAEIDVDETVSFVRQVFGSFSSDPMPHLQVELVENEDWTRKWIDNFKPVKFGERLWVCPSWSDIPDPDAVNLMLDPGLAFGTGTHPTTALCLRWLDSHDLKGKTVVDFGCGSGILGIAALLLGAKHVLAIDNDPQALIATRDNLQRNNLPEAQLTAALPDDIPDLKADILLANILAKPLYELKPVLTQLLQPEGHIVLSGILASQADALNTHYREDYVMDPIAQEGDWIRLTGTKSG